MAENSAHPFEFHVSRQARDRYQFDQALFSLSGTAIFANFHAARVFAQKMNQKRDLVHFPEQAIRAGQINAMGMIDEILHYVVRLYIQEVEPQAFHEALDSIEATLGRASLDQALRRFADEFPPSAVYRREISLDDYLAGATEGISNREILLEEMVNLWLTNLNPAMDPFGELFDDSALRRETAYPQIVNQVGAHFEALPSFGPEAQDLISMLRSPAVAVPYSLSGQLEYIRERWASLLGRYLYRLLSSLDLVKEEERLIFPAGAGPGPIPIPSYREGLLAGEAERFSSDREWMPNLVLIAKNSYVWLDQLSKKYQRSIDRLDLIPDEELDQLARWGFTGLWLIGLWERSRASAEIKQRMGNPEAVASAYSLAGYDIAADLGGADAYRSLRDRAWQRGIRLASDMVPNHMGIDSNWVMEHPDWFISLDYSPFPSYSFNSANLSNDPNVGIYIEDHYYDRSDAAVVFKRVDNNTGNSRFIYHGNDGTSMPWNDTAQLNYLNPQVREAVIQTILHVARMFPVIRFDAAMTLAKKHYQRLWFPEPGTGGAIPSRAEFGLTREQFDELMPIEFWREVVDRVAKEAPDTLLLAEAFWLMEGYFVRTLGMHRVYNSAFMNILRNEENAQYRTIMKNTLEFDPEILKRFVNFMNNPDERTAVEQFGKGDKYFGIATLMATMPGLPMFGHGQVEGFAEKYGMEFRRAYWDEKPDASLVQRHEREIFPLLRRRAEFAGVENFLLYDFFSPDGGVDENVFAYSNRLGEQRNLVVYNNRFSNSRGWIRTSAAYLDKAGGRGLVQHTLGEGLGLHADPAHFVIARDHLTGLESIRSSKDVSENGLYVELQAYQARVWLDIREVVDSPDGRYARLNQYLAGRGVPSIEEAVEELFLQPVYQAFGRLVNADLFRRLLAALPKDEQQPIDIHLLDEVETKALDLFSEVKTLTGGSADPAALAAEIRSQIKTLLELPTFEDRYRLPASRSYRLAVSYLQSHPLDDAATWATLIGWVFVHKLGKVAGPDHYEEISQNWFDEWRLSRILSQAALEFGVEEADLQRVITAVKVLTAQQRWISQGMRPTALQILEGWLSDPETQRFIGVNRFKGILWFNDEAFDEFLWQMMFLAVMQTSAELGINAPRMVEQVIASFAVIQQIRAATAKAEYQIEKLLEGLK
ncbi:MAG TPA: alpha-amylase family glycosyl hydrolase [Anaerolineaceae bacterium]|nr:alpha-amylase family glycosyl hydrolase [Anaerolineaceae bacterium]